MEPLSNRRRRTTRGIFDTSFSFRFNASVSYRFGSIFNNIVNPRFDGGHFFL